MQCHNRKIRAKHKMFQYRKRYGLHAILEGGADLDSTLGFNTASGMDCMQSALYERKCVDFMLFQYRKRYGLHAISEYGLPSRHPQVSIPQAVWIACNEDVDADAKVVFVFQYRKRYGLHAIKSPHR